MGRAISAWSIRKQGGLSCATGWRIAALTVLVVGCPPSVDEQRPSQHRTTVTEQQDRGPTPGVPTGVEGGSLPDADRARSERATVARQVAARQVAAQQVATQQVAALETVSRYRDSAARRPGPIDPLYTSLAADLKAGKPLLIAGFFGLSDPHLDDPEKNPCWGTYYGNARFMKRASGDVHVKKLYEFTGWTLLQEEENPTDPVRTLVFHQRINPSKAWKTAGVEEPFDAYLVMQAFESREQAATHMAVALRASRGATVELAGLEGAEQPMRLNLGDAQVVGYIGHNFFFDYEDFYWDGFEPIKERPSRPKGLFVISCMSGRVPGFLTLLGHNVHVLLLSRYFISAEGYSLLSVVDGVLQHASSRGLVDLADRTYQYFHTLHHPEKKVYWPFLGQDFRLYDEPLDRYFSFD